MVVDDEGYAAADLPHPASARLCRPGSQQRTYCAGCDRQEAPDLVILDVMMPGLSGIQVIRQLKQNPETTSVPVIMLSAKAQEEDIMAMLQSGADACLTKPFSLSDLVQSVEMLLGLNPSSYGE